MKKFIEFWKKLDNKQRINLISLWLGSSLVVGTAGFLAGQNKVDKTSEETIEIVQGESIDTFAEPQNEDNNLIDVVVKEGDTLSGIAVKYNTTVEEIVKLNNIDDPNNIYPGTILKVEKNSKEEIVENTIQENQEEQSAVENSENFTDNQDTITENSEEVAENDESLTNVSDGNQYDTWEEDLANKGYVKGIDVSFRQDDMDLNKVLQENDIKFVITRMAYFWSRDQIDESFYQQARICKENNVALGVYFWPTFRDVETAEKELDIILSALDELREKEGIYLDMPICLDIENSQDGGGYLVKRIINEDPKTLEAIEYTINRLQNEEGYYTMIYCSDNVSQVLGEKLKSFNLDVWISKYYTNKDVQISDEDVIIQSRKYGGISTIRQYSDHGRVAGYDKDVDLNVCYYNLPEIIKNNNLNHHNDLKLKKTID